MNGIWHITALSRGLTAFLVRQASCRTCREREPAAWPDDCRWHYQEEVPNLRRLLGGAALELNDIEKQLGGGK